MRIASLFAFLGVLAITPAAFEFIPKDIAVELPTYAENLAVSVREDDEWEADRIAAIEERFTQWLSS